MFTGIIRERGTVLGISHAEADPIYTIGAPEMAGGLTIGASVAVCGICLTVISQTIDFFKVQLSTETMNITNASSWVEGSKVNLEPSLRFGDELGGHLVSGHVDGTLAIVEKYAEGSSLRLRLALAQNFRRFIAPKGTITLNGVSLTINDVAGDSFGVNIIPHTQVVTTFGQAEIGEAVNFEVDMIARYLDRLQEKTVMTA